MKHKLILKHGGPFSPFAILYGLKSYIHWFIQAMQVAGENRKAADSALKALVDDAMQIKPLNQGDGSIEIEW